MCNHRHNRGKLAEPIGPQHENVSAYLQNVIRPLEIRFTELAQHWRKETETASSTADITAHPAYQEIIGMGKSVLPFIFREMAANGGHWFWALRRITQENPVSSKDAGNVQKMTEAWLRWGGEHQYM